MSIISLIEFETLGDDRGGLVSIESNKNIPFEIKRVYYIYGTEAGVARGFHAHKSLQQIAICISGSCRFILDDGKCIEDVILNSPNVGLYINSMKWREMHDFSEDCVLMVLADHSYDEADYIRNYQKFKNEVSANGT